MMCWTRDKDASDVRDASDEKDASDGKDALDKIKMRRTRERCVLGDRDASKETKMRRMFLC